MGQRGTGVTLGIVQAILVRDHPCFGDARAVKRDYLIDGDEQALEQVPELNLTLENGLGKSTIYTMLANKKLASIKVGGRRLILRESLDALLSA